MKEVKFKLCIFNIVFDEVEKIINKLNVNLKEL